MLLLSGIEIFSGDLTQRASPEFRILSHVQVALNQIRRIKKSQMNARTQLCPKA
jgi:hypothetical protein